MSSETHEFSDYAQDDTNGKGVAIGAAVIVLMVVLAVAISWPIYHYFFRLDQPRFTQTPPYRFSHGASYQTSIESSWQSLVKANSALIDTYGPGEGGPRAVRIPLDEAMRLAARHGLPQWPSAGDETTDWHAHYLRVRQERLSREYAP